MLKQGLNYVKSRIREAAAQAHPESPPRPKTYSWTAAFVLRASFAVAKCVACVSTCVREETVEFFARAKRFHATKNSCGLVRKHIDLSPCAQRHVLAKRLLRSRTAR